MKIVKRARRPRYALILSWNMVSGIVDATQGVRDEKSTLDHKGTFGALVRRGLIGNDGLPTKLGRKSAAFTLELMKHRGDL